MLSGSFVVFILYIVSVLLIGFFQKNKESSDFWTASHSLSGWSVGLSISAGFMSISWSCVYATQVYYWYGLGGIWLVSIPWIISLLVIYKLSQRFNNLPAFSQPEMAGLRYGTQGRIIISMALIFVFLVWGGAEIYIAATLLAPGLNLSPFSMISIIALVVGTYSLTGGFKAVVMTDKLQFALVGLYIILVSIAGFIGVNQSAAPFTLHLFPAKSSVSWLHLFSPGFALILISFIAYLPGWIFETDLWVRIQASRSGSEARKGISISIFNSILFVGIFPLLIASMALYLYPPSNGVIPATLGLEGDAIFLRIIQDFLPGWLLPVVSLGLIAAAMSTIDTCTNIVSLSLGYDLYKSFFKHEPSQLINRTATVIGVFLTWLFALNTESLWDIFYLSSGILSTTVAIPMLGIVWTTLRPRAVMASSWAGFITTFLSYYAGSSGFMNSVTPDFVASTGLGYIAWGLLSAIIFLILFQIWETKKLPAH